MIRSQNLDDQTFESIVESAVNRIPYIYPEWTDYNPHDPGITLIELFAWYKEMQQYHMNVVTEDLKRKLLGLAGVRPEPARSASYLVEFPPGSGSFPALSQMENDSGVGFELTERAHVPMNDIGKVYLRTENGVRDLSDIAVADMAELPSLTSPGASLWIGMHITEMTDTFRLWFDVAPGDPPRNPFGSREQMPRRLAYGFSGAGRAEPVDDETHGLTVSGFLTFRTPAGWTEICPEEGMESLHYFHITVEDPGCEAVSPVTRVAANVFRAKQRETLARTNWFTIDPAEGAEAALTDALSLAGGVLAYVRTPEGLVQRPDPVILREGDALRLILDGREAAADGEPNLLTISLDPVRQPLMLRDSTGLPRQRLEIEAKENAGVDGGVVLLCDTLHPDGVVRPALWRQTDDLLTAGPRDRVFEILREDGWATILFGDGEHGDIVPAGKYAILIADLAVTLAARGNVPDGADMPLLDGNAAVSYRRETPGREAETVDEAASRLLRRLAAPCKCVSEEDYEAIALHTPGLKILAAKALTMYDPDAPVASGSPPVVTMVVVPAGAGERPAPNEWFLDTVRAHIAKKRTICTHVKVTGPLYVGVHVAVRMLTQDENIEAKLRAALRPFFDVAEAGSLIGRTMLRSDVEVAVGSLPETLKLTGVRLTPDTAACHTDRNGDLSMPRHAMPYLASLTVERI